MKILINTSNLKKGGALQVAHSFLSEIKSNHEDIFHVVLSNELAKQTDENSFPGNFKFYSYSLNPNIYKAFTGRDIILDKLEKDFNPDCIFSVFGPTYWRPKSPHIVGFANGWCYNPDSVAFSKLSIKSKISYHLSISIKNYCLKKEYGVLIVETQDAKNKISSILKIRKDRIFVVGNTYNEVYNNQNPSPFYLHQREEKEFRLVTISANYPHKNLKIIKEVIPLLQQKGLNVKFLLTIEPQNFMADFSAVKDSVVNLGPVNIQYGPSLYAQTDALFLPTLLETFTASYPEAMKIGKPILTSDLSFAHDICGEAAEYFNPLDPADIADKIEQIIKNKKRREELIQAGYKQLEKFETASSRAQKYLEICKKIASKT